MTHDPAERIRDEIARRGPLTFARFMELALYGEGGYYGRPPVGAGGDFVTSPHVHQVFATMLASALRELHGALGEPTPFRVVEAGAGDGTLARALIAELTDLPLRYAATEVSPGARHELEAIAGVEAVGDTVEGPFDILVANELLDNLPFKVFRDGRELGVGLDRGGRLVEVALGDAEPPPPGDDVVVPEGALAFVDAIAAEIGTSPGYALVIDYGEEGQPSGAAHGYAQHRVVEDLLADPGRTDITAGVDFALLRERAAARGLTAFPTVTQRAALLALGYDAWVTERRSDQGAQLDRGEGIEAVRTWSERSRASLLVDPGALGRFRWLLLATPGLPEPSWLVRASADAG